MQLDYSKIPHKEMMGYVQLGKELDALAVEHKAERLFGKNKARLALAKALECSPVSIHHAFWGKAPLKLYQINSFLTNTNLPEATAKISNEQ